MLLDIEPVHLADTMSPLSVASAVAEQVQELGALPWAILRAAMLQAGYDPLDIQAVWRIVAAMAGFGVDGAELVWIG